MKHLALAALVAAFLALSADVASAHRLSGKTGTLADRIKLVRAQVAHDRLELKPLHSLGWRIVRPGNDHGHWLEADLRHLHRLTARATRASTPYPAWWLRAALCVKSKEGGWSSNTGNGFYGGFQFDYGTWLSNGGGRFAPYAHMASRSEQILVAYWTWQRRGWYPWPTTARMCGLL